MNERPIPPAALRDGNAVEMLRVWIAEQRLHCSMKVGMYRESMGIPEEEAWGVILADAARHLAQALQEKYGEDQQDAIEKIKNSFLTELAKPTSKAEGGFV
ncbi:DUF5076 domain-containing protein [Pseudoduganella violacea]|uniref:DUF5076 domain-containing protein n=1 Tax=Pseudoduganella violacea TaxID=1715466 RepID=A0A7W5BE79_9BURK|nr:DUF5076 domain-containing protein [Pseudoduganella violacea]MBB3121513.1 hypothetical protein [Pseudoduganella violacea]